MRIYQAKYIIERFSHVLRKRVQRFVLSANPWRGTNKCMPVVVISIGILWIPHGWQLMLTLQSFSNIFIISIYWFYQCLREWQFPTAISCSSACMHPWDKKQLKTAHKGVAPWKKHDILFMLCWTKPVSVCVHVHRSQNQSKLLLVFTCGFHFICCFYIKDIRKLLK